jgi:hypothetical protein
MKLSDAKVGQLVRIGPRYCMGGTYESDEITGKVFRIVCVAGGIDLGPGTIRSNYPDIALADPDIVEADEGDADWLVSPSRATLIDPNGESV